MIEQPLHGPRTVKRIILTCNNIGVTNNIHLLFFAMDRQVCVNVKGLKWKWNCYLCRPKESFNLLSFHAWHEMVWNNFFFSFDFVCVCFMLKLEANEREIKVSKFINHYILHGCNRFHLHDCMDWDSHSPYLSCLRSTDRWLLFFVFRIKWHKSWLRSLLSRYFHCKFFGVGCISM